MKSSLFCSLLLGCFYSSLSLAASSAAAAEGNPELVIKPIPAWVSELKETAKPATSAPVQRLVTDDQFRLTGNERSHFYHQVEVVQGTEGLASVGQLQIAYDPTFQKLTMHRVEVVRDGKHINQLNRQTVQFLHRETELERFEINGLVTASVILNDIRLGDRIDVAYSVDGANPVFENRFADVRGEGNEKAPVSQYRYRLIYPASREILFKIPDRVHQASIEKDGFKQVDFTDSDVPQMVSEQGASLRDYYPQFLQISEWKNWDEIADWGTRLFELKGTDTAALSAKRAEFAGASDPVLATINFVQKDIRYFAREIGFNTHRPTAPDKIMEQRSGDCKDKVMLLLALLKAEGIEAKPVLVNLSNPLLERNLPSPLAFNHVVAQVTINGTTTLIDATRDSQTGPLHEREAYGYGKGLLVEKGNDQDVMALPNLTDQPSIDVTDEIDIAHLKDGATVTSRVKLRGTAAEFVRLAIAKQPKDFKTGWLDPIMRSYPGATVVQDPTIEEVPNENALTVISVLKASEPYDSSNLAVLSVNATYWMMVNKLRTPSMTTRQTSYDLGPPLLMRQTLHYILGETGLTGPQQNSSDNGDNHLHLHTQFTGAPKDIRMTGDLRVTGRYVEPADWAAFTTSLQPIRKAASQQVNFPIYSVDTGAKLAAEITRITTVETAKKTPAADIKLKTASYVLEQELAADRMPPQIRARIDLAYSSLLANQNQCLKARDPILEATALAPAVPEMFATLAADDLCLAQDDDALKQVNHAIELRPNDGRLILLRGCIYFVAGHFDLAMADFKDSAAHIDASQMALPVTWVCLTSMRLGGDCKAAIQPYLSDVSDERWPGPVVPYLLGKKDAEAMLSAAKADTGSPAEVGEAYFFMAEKQLASNARADAIISFKHVGETRGHSDLVSLMAERELARPAAAPNQ